MELQSRRRTRSWPIFVLSLALPALLIGMALLESQPRSQLYNWVRSYHRSRALAQVQSLPALPGRYVTVFYPPQLRQDAVLILKAAEAAYPLVAEKVGGMPPGTIPVVAHASSTSLQEAFGWTSLQPAAGVYWGGVVRVLAPSAWIESTDDREKAEIYAATNPLAHELTHYALDYRTNGNYPRWFSEGLAQRVEYQATGFLLAGPQPAAPQYGYSLKQLEAGFDHLPDQTLAYQISLGLVDAMADRCGGDPGLRRVIGQLGGGEPFWPAVWQSCGLDRQTLEALTLPQSSS